MPDPLTEEANADALQQLLAAVARDFQETASRTGCTGLSQPVQDALAAVPRHVFIPAEQSAWAYTNRPLPIGRGQTISQPFIVALMTELLALPPQATVLEIGTGSGYQTAILAQLAQWVYSVERIPELAESATVRLHELGYPNVTIRVGDGGIGWAAHAPFDAIMVTAAATEIPVALTEQLKPGGRLVIPVGAMRGAQDLQVLEKDMGGQIHARSVLSVVFVPLIRADESE